MRLPLFSAFLLALVPALGHSDSVKPVRFGPYLVNSFSLTGNPASYEYALANGYYRLLVGWIEPFSESAGGLFKDAYFETDGDLNISPFQSDLGTAFNIKPIRYFELGLSYNRLMFHSSMVTFIAPGQDMIDLDLARPGDIMQLDRAFGGADVFTFQANFTLDIGPTQFYLIGSRALWDVDVRGKDFVYEYGNDLVIKPRDRINTLVASWSLDLGRYARNPTVSYSGLFLRNQYWNTARSDQEKNLISAGITGMRLGRNPELQKRGLNASVGYWTLHPQLEVDDWVKSLNFTLEWQWSLHFLKL